MYQKKECVAMLLAGGQGSRLSVLTEKNAKPAVQFGGKYRIIDFTLSNCVNSGLDTVGVLTQYQPLVLNEYIGNGQPWDLDRTFGGVMVLPPYQGKRSADWYKGTANAIFQNLNFIRRYKPEYVLILSGDHIYKMDYSKMLEYHKQKHSECTIAVIDVPLEEASRFGIMTSDTSSRIIDFEEKPKKPTSTKASMGIYIFSYSVLENYLTIDNEDEESSKDFGKNVIPNMLKNNVRMYAYPFEGYWKDVGTIESLWEANMDLLGKSPVFDLYDRTWRIFSRTHALPAQYIGEYSEITNSIITEGCEIDGKIVNSVISSGVIVEKGAVIRNSVIMCGCIVRKNATIDYALVDSGCEIGEGTTIGDKNAREITVIEGGASIHNNSVIPGGEIIKRKKMEKKQKGDK